MSKILSLKNMLNKKKIFTEHEKKFFLQNVLKYEEIFTKKFKKFCNKKGKKFFIIQK